MFNDVFGASSSNPDGIVFAADFFSDTVIGGAELTTDALIEAVRPRSVTKVRLASTPEEGQIRLADQHRDKLWVFGNFSFAKPAFIEKLVQNQTRYLVVEYDYKLCSYRSPQLHQLKVDVPCDCHTTQLANFISYFYGNARHVFFMSEAQRSYYTEKMTGNPWWQKATTSVLSSVWSKTDVARLKLLRTRPKVDKWAVLSGGSWIKAESQTVSWCQEKGLPFELIGGLPPVKFLETLASFMGLVFRPAGWDTCPRIVIEAKAMGLHLLLNENVQHQQEEWFKADDIFPYLESRQETFRERLENHLTT